MIQGIERKYLCVALWTLLLFSGCRLGDSAPFTTNQPNIKDLIGTWRPTPATLRDMQERGHYNTENAEAKIILRADGQVELQNMPDWWLDGFGESHGRLLKHDGTWELRQTNRYWEVLLSLNDVTTDFSIKELAPPYKLHRYVGDPDSADEMIFLRQEQ